MENINGQNQGNALQMGAQTSKLEHLRGILAKLHQSMEARRDERLGRKTAPQVEMKIAFPRENPVVLNNGKPKAMPKSLSDFEAAFARLTNRQAS